MWRLFVGSGACHWPCKFRAGATTSELSNNRTASATQTLARWSFPDWALIGQFTRGVSESTYFKYFPHPQCPCRFRQTSPAIYPASLRH